MFNVYIDTRDNILNEARQRVGTFSVFFFFGQSYLSFTFHTQNNCEPGDNSQTYFHLSCLSEGNGIVVNKKLPNLLAQQFSIYPKISSNALKFWNSLSIYLPPECICCHINISKICSEADIVYVRISTDISSSGKREINKYGRWNRENEIKREWEISYYMPLLFFVLLVFLLLLLLFFSRSVIPFGSIYKLTIAFQCIDDMGSQLNSVTKTCVDNKSSRYWLLRYYYFALVFIQFLFRYVVARCCCCCCRSSICTVLPIHLAFVEISNATRALAHLLVSNRNSFDGNFDTKVSIWFRCKKNIVSLNNTRFVWLCHILIVSPVI